MRKLFKEKEMKSIRHVFMFAIVFVLLVFSLPITSFAAGGELYVTINQVFTSTSTVADTFDYRFATLDPTNPMPAGSTADGYAFSITGTDEVDIGPITYTLTGIYEYQLVPVILTKLPGYTYDEKEYDVTVYVDEHLNFEVIYSDNVTKVKTAEIEYKNKYEAKATDPELMVDPPVRKTVTGNPSSASVFRFRLEAANINNPMPPGSSNGIKEMTTTGNGEVEFGTWSYTAEGVYFYTIKEINTSISGYTYDTEVYTITDTVTLVGNQLVLNRVVVNKVNQVTTSCDFINVYKKPSVFTLPFTGDSSNAWLFYALTGVSLIMIVAAVYFLIAGKKNKRHQPN